MEKYLNRFYDVIDKIGKHNFILIIFIFVAILSTGLYQTFSLYTESEGLSILDNIKTYSFILKNNGEENSVVIAPNSSKNIDITVTNESETDLKYGLYYSKNGSVNYTNIGYLENTSYPSNGVITKNSSYIVTVKVDNLSNENLTIKLGLKYGFENGGELNVEEGEYWFHEYYRFLYEMPVGSYVAYTGNNGCSTTKVNGRSSCSGNNINYVNDTNMGYCDNSYYKFNVNGWRIGYTEDRNVHLISAGATDCLCTNSDGTTSSSGSCLNYLSATDLYKHLDNLNSFALKYCNNSYAKGGVCDNTTTWAANAIDFEKIVKKPLTSSSCYGSSQDTSCGYNNNLIDNGGYYWLATQVDSLHGLFYWRPSVQNAYIHNSSGFFGVRPVIALDYSIVVVGGNGTYEEPYIIKNIMYDVENEQPVAPELPDDDIKYLNEVSIGSYVKYVGNNGCDTTLVYNYSSCSGKNNAYENAGYLGFCGNSNYLYNFIGWRIAYVEDGSAHLISGGATDCLCTNSDGTTPLNGVCTDYLDENGLYIHLNYLNQVALKYCNTSYAKGGVCDNTTTWAANANDFEKILKKPLNASSCYESSEDTSCGYANNLIDIGGYYWIATQHEFTRGAYMWTPGMRYVHIYNSSFYSGIRPVLALDSSVRIIGGTGTYKDPYLISNE